MRDGIRISYSAYFTSPTGPFIAVPGSDTKKIQSPCCKLFRIIFNMFNSDLEEFEISKSTRFLAFQC